MFPLFGVTGMSASLHYGMCINNELFSKVFMPVLLPMEAS